MLEGVTETMFDNVASPRVLNTHLPLRLLPKDILKMNSKIIFVQRNPKDICVSFYNHHKKILEYDYDGKFENYVNRFLNGLGKRKRDILLNFLFSHTYIAEKLLVHEMFISHVLTSILSMFVGF